MRRFYKIVEVAPQKESFSIRLDGKPIRTPAKAPLLVPTRALANAVADEWRAQSVVVVPATMPMTQLVTTSIDSVTPMRAAVVDDLLAYAGTDLICYWAEQPDDLIRRQEAAWQPLLEWAADALGARLVATRGVMPVEQRAEARRALARAVADLPDPTLTGVRHAAALTGSLVLAFAMLRHRLDPAQVFAAAVIDETFQAERWGEDTEAAARREGLAAELTAVGRFLDLLAEP
ncbi:MAG: ATP12 family chaperone protein [Inquilinaceae bacterium]